MLCSDDDRALRLLGGAYWLKVLLERWAIRILDGNSFFARPHRPASRVSLLWVLGLVMVMDMDELSIETIFRYQGICTTSNGGINWTSQYKEAQLLIPTCIFMVIPHSEKEPEI